MYCTTTPRPPHHSCATKLVTVKIHIRRVESESAVPIHKTRVVRCYQMQTAVTLCRTCDKNLFQKPRAKPSALEALIDADVLEFMVLVHKSKCYNGASQRRHKGALYTPPTPFVAKRRHHTHRKGILKEVTARRVVIPGKRKETERHLM